MNVIEDLQKLIDESNNIVFFTGAGISTESGIPDFRSKDGLYNVNKNAEEILSHHYFVDHTAEFYDFYRTQLRLMDVEPNAAHRYIAELEKRKNVTVVTQNIDGLHQKAGSTDVIEVHGSIASYHCQKCGKKSSYQSLKEKLFNEKIPHCECGGIIKPDVVLYEEALNSDDIENAIYSIENADTLIVCGTSLVVYPAAGFIRYYRGSNLIIVNRDPTQYDYRAKLCIQASLAELFKQLH